MGRGSCCPRREAHEQRGEWGLARGFAGGHDGSGAVVVYKRKAIFKTTLEKTATS